MGPFKDEILCEQNCVRAQQRGRKRSPSLETNPGERRESRASSIASYSEEDDRDFKRMTVAEGLLQALLCQLNGRDSDGAVDEDSIDQEWIADASSLSPTPSEHYQPSTTSPRPHHEPPILDYRAFEEDGSMYHSINRHPDTKPEEWYQYTDAEIEVHLLGDYHDFVHPMHQQALENRDEQREKFYEGLERELNIDRFQVENEFEDIKERIYVERVDEDKNSKPINQKIGKSRVQKQFDDVRKAWRVLDSEHSNWDEEEWEIFNREERQIVGGLDTVGHEHLRAPLTEGNLKRLEEDLEARITQGSGSGRFSTSCPAREGGTSAATGTGYFTAEGDRTDGTKSAKSAHQLAT